MSLLDGTVHLQSDQLQAILQRIDRLLADAEALRFEVKRFNDFCERIQLRPS